jgi:hypothetical protein
LRSVTEYNQFLCYTPESKSVEFLGKHSFTLHPSLDPYGQNHRQRNTYTCFAWAGGTFFTLAARGLEKLFLQLCCCVSFWSWRGIGIGFTYSYVLRVQYSCGVVLVFLILAGNSVFVLRKYLAYDTVVRLC